MPTVNFMWYKVRKTLKNQGFLDTHIGLATSTIQCAHVPNVPKFFNYIRKGKCHEMAKSSKSYRPLTFRSSVRTLELVFYDEQLPYGWLRLKETIKSIDKSKMQILSIKHNKDEGISHKMDEEVLEKDHYMVIIRMCNNKTAKVGTLLNMLKIEFRPASDQTLWENGGCRTIRNFSDRAMYLIHETEEAILDHKPQYSIDDIFSNLDRDEIKQIMEGYVRVGKKKIDNETMAELDQYAYDLGYKLGSFESWYSSLEFAIRKNAGMRTIKESYYRGVEERAKKGEEINRLCVFIQGAGNSGKTYSAIHSFENNEKLIIDGGGTGKYDRLTVSTDVVIVDDQCSNYLLNMADNKICQVYRRGSNNPFWCGRYFIITSNYSFEDWAEMCGIAKEIYIRGVKIINPQYSALLSRFYTCHIESGQLVVDTYSDRGSDSFQEVKLEMFLEFRDKYNAILSQYKKGKSVDYSVLFKKSEGVEEETELEWEEEETECEEVYSQTEYDYENGMQALENYYKNEKK